MAAGGTGAGGVQQELKESAEVEVRRGYKLPHLIPNDDFLQQSPTSSRFHSLTKWLNHPGNKYSNA